MQVHITGILLAAGRSRRMAGENKLLRKIEGVSLLRRSALALLASNTRFCMAVVLDGFPDIHNELSDLPITIISAPSENRELSKSIRAGVLACPSKTDAIIIALADMPMIKPEHFNKLIATFAPKHSAQIVCPVDETGKRGHPVLFDHKFAAALANLNGDKGARALLLENQNVVTEIAMDRAVGIDLDTPEDWNDWEKSNS